MKNVKFNLSESDNESLEEKKEQKVKIISESNATQELEPKDIVQTILDEVLAKAENELFVEDTLQPVKIKHQNKKKQSVNPLLKKKIDKKKIFEKEIDRKLPSVKLE